jgi:hypothetical protein
MMLTWILVIFAGAVVTGSAAIAQPIVQIPPISLQNAGVQAHVFMTGAAANGVTGEQTPPPIFKEIGPQYSPTGIRVVDALGGSVSGAEGESAVIAHALPHGLALASSARSNSFGGPSSVAEAHIDGRISTFDIVKVVANGGRAIGEIVQIDVPYNFSAFVRNTGPNSEAYAAYTIRIPTVDGLREIGGVPAFSPISHPDSPTVRVRVGDELFIRTDFEWRLASLSLSQNGDGLSSGFLKVPINGTATFGMVPIDPDVTLISQLGIDYAAPVQFPQDLPDVFANATELQAISRGVVPEPSSAILLCSGLLFGLLFQAFRQQRE